MPCTIIYKDQTFETPEQLLEYAEQNNIEELLSEFRAAIPPDEGKYYQLVLSELESLKPISEQFDNDITEFNQYITRSNQADIKERKREPISQIDQEYLENSKFSKGYVFQLGKPSSILQSVGMPNLPIQVVSDYFKDHIINDPKHKLKTLNLKGLVEAIHNPIAIWKDKDFSGEDGRIEIVTTIKSRNGKNVNVLIQFNREVISRGEVLNINNIKTAFEVPTSTRFENSVIDGNIQYIDKKRIINYLQGSHHFSEIVNPKSINDSSTKLQKVLFKIKNFPDNLTDTQKLYQKAIATGDKSLIDNPESSKASSETISRVKDFLKRIGIKVESLTQITDNQGNILDINGIADTLNKLIQVVDGKEDVTLTEEAMHMAVEMIEQKNEKLFNKLLNRIGKYEIYKQVLNTYSSDPNYRTKDNKPDIRKLKKEAIGKVLAEYVILNNEGSIEKPENIAQVQGWWQEILSFLKRLFNIADFNPFEEVAKQINEGTESESGGILEGVRKKEGVDFVFEQNPKLANIGTKEQYSQYLDTIFPYSKVKNIVYHGTMEQLIPKDSFKGYVTYLTDDKTYAETFGVPVNRKVIPAVIDIRNPYNSHSELADVPLEVHNTDQFTNPRIIKQNNSNKFDSVIGVDAGQKQGTTFAVFNSFQIHILGSNADMLNFKKWIKDDTKIIRKGGIIDLGAIYFQKANKKEYNTTEQKSEIDSQFEKILEIHKKLSKQSDTNGNSYYVLGGKKVKNRVTDISKRYYERLFGDKEITKSDFQKSVDDLKKEQGTKGHLDFEDLFHRYIDDNGYLRDEPLDQSGVSNIDPNDNSKYLKLEAYFSKMITMYPKGTRFLSEVQVYDPQRDEAGTIDFMAIAPDKEQAYKIDIRDWKFMDLSDKQEDVPWYKQEAFNKQIGEYKRILKTVYGDKNEQFRQTRAIPILTSYGWNDPKKHDKLVLKNIVIGDPDVKKIEDSRLLPVATKDERTGNPIIDKLIDKLNEIYRSVSQTSVREHRKDIKAAQLNAIFKAIRQLQIKQNLEPTIQLAKIQIETINNLLKTYSKAALEELSSDALSNEEISHVVTELLDARSFADTYSKLDIDLYGLIEDPDTLDDLRKVSFDARKLENSIEDTYTRFFEKFAANQRGVTDILSPERVVQFIGKQFKYLSQSQTASMRVLWKMNEEVEQKVAIETDEENKKILDIKQRYVEWAKSKGLNPKQYFDILKKKDKKGHIQHELIDEISSEFYSKFREAKQKNDSKWFEDNIDWDKYEQFSKEYLEKRYAEIDQNVYLGTEDEIEKRRIYEKKKLEDEFDVLGNKFMRWFPVKDKWYSKEFRELMKPENEIPLEFYKYIQEANNIGKSSGYLNARQARTFLPFLRKDLVDQLVFDGKLGLKDAFINSISVTANDIGYTRDNPLTGEIDRSIPKYYTTNIGQPVYDENGELDYIDYSNVSDNLFESMAAYRQQLIRYQYLVNLEGQVKGLLSIEKNKRSIATSKWGNIIWENGEPKTVNSNKENYELLEKFVNAIIYGEKYSGQSTDVSLGKVSNKFANAINKKLGSNVIPNDADERRVSLVKTADTVNRWFAMKTLGLSIPSSLSQFLGGNFQAMINSGSWFDGKDFLKSEMELMANKFNGKDGKIRAALKEYFIPLSEDLTMQQRRQLGIKPLEKFSMANSLMVMMRYADKAVEYSIFYAMMKNTMIENGELVNIRKYVKAKPEYANRYAKGVSVAERRILEQKMRDEIEELQKTRSLEKIATIDENGDLSLPGVDRKSETVLKYRSLIQQISKAATGNLSGNDINGARLTVIGRSFMMFKNWIPRLYYNRISELEHNEGVDEYQWGRMRMMFGMLSWNIFDSAKKLTNMLKANEKGMDSLREFFQKTQQEYKERTGRDLEMTEAEFYDLVRKNLRGQMKDFIAAVSLFGMFLAAKALPPDDDEDKSVKSFYKFSLRMLDKVSDEITFYYNPISFQQILNGSVFPSLGAVTDVVKLVEHVGQYGFGLALQNDQWVETAHVPKYMMKTFPITKELLNYLAFFLPDLATDMGVTISSQSRLR